MNVRFMHRMVVSGARLFSSCAFLFLLFTSSNTLAQVIPNGSFEEWGELGPVDWTTQNTLVDYKPVAQSDRAVDGSLSLHVQVVDSTGLKDVPYCFVGDYISLGFPIEKKPSFFNGFISTSFRDDDNVSILVVMMRQGSIVGNGDTVIRENIEDFTQFSLPIEYFADVQPDQARIILGLGEPPVTVGSEFFIDALTFSNEPLEVSTMTSQESFAVTSSGEGAVMRFSIQRAEFVLLDIIDLYGRTVENLYTGVTDSSMVYWDGDGLPNGMYFARLTRPDRTEVRKVVLNH